MLRLDWIRRVNTQRDWANRRVLEGMQRQNLDPKALSLFAHVLSAERAWIARLNRRPTEGMEIWQSPTLDQCRKVLRENSDGFAELIEKLTDAELDTTVTYRNFKGIEFTTPIGDILTHVAMHGSYHRGQVAQAMRLAGLEPIETDFIVFQRVTS